MFEGWNSDLSYRIAFVLYAVPFGVMRLYYETQSRMENSESNYREPVWMRSTILVMELAGMLAMVAWVFNPKWMLWSEVSLPVSLRWGGFVLGALGALSTFWVHRFLGKNFSPYLHIREGHQLIMSGPYRYARHPMYTSLYLLSIGTSLLMANWFVFLSQVATLTAVLIYRLPREEALILEVFGDEYQEYSKRVGRFCPLF